MSGERHGENHNTGSGDGVCICVPGNFGCTGLRGDAPSRILGLFQVARADADRCAGLSKAKRESATFCSGTAYDCDVRLHE
jgi:hypothetical protein